MPTTGESKEVIDEERTIELKKDRRSRKIAVTKTRHNLDSLRARGGDSELNQDGRHCRNHWKPASPLCLGENENKNSVAVEGKGSENEINNASERGRTCGKGNRSLRKNTWMLAADSPTEFAFSDNPVARRATLVNGHVTQVTVVSAFNI